MANTFISIEDVHFQHPVRGGESTPALNGINLQIEEGEYVAIVGANGSGKTTLARHLNALLLPSRGRVLINGKDTRDPQNHPSIRAAIGMVFQSPEDQIVAAVLEEDIAFGPENMGLPPAEIRARVEAALTTTGLLEHRDRPPHLLSAGQMQRAALAGVLAMHPRCVIMDETTAMLDPGGRAMVKQLIQRLHSEGLTVIVITHFMREAVEADRVVALKEGRVAFDGPPGDIFTHPSDLLSLNLDLPLAARLAETLRTVFPGLPLGILTPDSLFKALPEYTGTQIADIPPRSQRQRRDCPEAIRVESLEHIYLSDTPLAHTALSGATMCAAEGSSHGLIGSTGSGKSTLLQHLNGLLVPQHGKVTVGPFDLNDSRTDLKAVRRYAGLVFQNPEFQLFEQYVGDEIAYAPRLMGKDNLRETVRAAMTTVGLDFEAYKDRLTFSLSGGERRKVAVASILAMDPAILLLDEPTASLDPRSRREVLTHMQGLHSRGKTLVISSHHMEDIAELAENVTALAHGRDQLSGSAASVFHAVDRIKALGLEAPLVSQAAAVLRSCGWPLPDDILRPVELAEALSHLVEGTHA
jgi:energy-coupling factor transport system ATP-binding protein